MNNHAILNALTVIEKFTNGDSKKALMELANQYIGKRADEIVTNQSTYEAAIIIKKASAQINEIVHAFGIINCLPSILQEGEIVESLSLASAASGEGIDLVTNIRIAEFKFSEWQKSNANGTRKRAICADYVSLLLNDDPRKKELYVFDAERISLYLQSKKAEWKHVLSKHPKLLNRLQDKNIEGKYLCDLYNPNEIEILDLKDYLSK